MVRVSVIIPVYNCAGYIQECLDSVLAQDLKNIELEIIVIDDGSTDDTGDIVALYTLKHRNIRYKRIQNSGNPGVPRNIGIRMTEGEYIAFLDADDLWHPKKLQKQIELFSDSDVMLTWTNAEAISPEGKQIDQRYLKRSQFHSGYVFKELTQDNFVITSASMIRRSVLKNTGVFMESDKYNVCQDYDLWLRIAHKNKLAYIDEPLIKYRHHKESISKRNAQWALRDIIIVLKHQLYFNLSRADRAALYASIAHKYHAMYEASGLPWGISSYAKWAYFSFMKKFTV